MITFFPQSELLQHFAQFFTVIIRFFLIINSAMQNNPVDFQLVV